MICSSLASAPSWGFVEIYLLVRAPKGPDRSFTSFCLGTYFIAIGNDSSVSVGRGRVIEEVTCSSRRVTYQKRLGMYPRALASRVKKPVTLPL